MPADTERQAAGGEGGIRTLGPPQGGQRFSRPPRSTAPAPLQGNGDHELAARTGESKGTPASAGIGAEPRARAGGSVAAPVLSR
jgi:hypothetical protein